MAIKLDMGQAWNDAVALLMANKDVILIVAAVFFFLPNAAATLLMPQSAELEAMAASGNPADFEAMSEMMLSLYAEIWWVIVLLGILQAIGVLGLLALLTDAARPTVGEALGFGLKAILPYIAVQLLTSMIFAFAVILPIAFGALIHPALAGVLGLVGFVLAIYIGVKLSLTSPVIAIEKVMNPISVLARSWKLTKGNSLRLFAFYVLLILVLIVITAITSMVWSVFSIMGDQVGLFATAIGSSIVNMGVVSIMLAVLAAVHRQLSGGSAPSVTETFE